MIKDLFLCKKDKEKFIDHEVPYLSASGTIMYLANYTQSDVAYSVNLLVRYIMHQLKDTGRN